MLIPVWMVVVAAVLLVLAAIWNLAFPSIRSYLRWRRRRVIETINSALPVHLPALALMRRSTVIDQLANDEKVLEMVEEIAARRGEPKAALVKSVRAYARSIVPALSPFFYFRVYYWIARHFIRAAHWVHVGYVHEDTKHFNNPKSCVVMIGNHRSNMDGLLIPYVTLHRTMLSFGAGEWSRIWPFKQMMKATGAYFIRRDSGDPLYRRVLERYIHAAVNACVPQGLFIEGALSRDGRIQPARLGMLDYMIRTFDPAGEHDIVILPVATNYDRIAEDRNLIGDPASENMPKSARFVLGETVGFALGMVFGRVLGHRHPMGCACANFGAPISLKQWLGERGIDLRQMPKAERFEWIARLAGEVLGEISALVPVVPTPLIAAVMSESHEETMSGPDIVGGALELAKALSARGAHVYLPGNDQRAAVSGALKQLIDRGLVVDRGLGSFQIKPEDRALMEYYANSIEHLRGERPARPARTQDEPQLAKARKPRRQIKTPAHDIVDIQTA
ncbi:MAG: 1-acyl-sn-glycerol-3-phosphate acyltransferase [Alphaproteobacteria bacterium]